MLNTLRGCVDFCVEGREVVLTFVLNKIISILHLEESHFWCFHIIQDFYKIICDPPLTIKSYAGDFEQRLLLAFSPPLCFLA